MGHKCLVRVPNDWDFSSAQFFIDGIAVPYKVDYMAPSGLAYLSNQIFAHAETGISQGKNAASGFFAWCRPAAPSTESTKNGDGFFGHCYRPPVLKEDIISE